MALELRSGSDHATELAGPLAAVPALPMGTVIDRYEVLGLLGIGGIARVYRVRHRSLGSLHALKVLALDRPSLRQRALQEGQVQATLRHPNLVAVTDIVSCDGAPALVLEYVAGPSLEQMLGARQLTLQEGDHLAHGVLRGVAYAHRHGVVHRDIKPGNILLEVGEGHLTPRVTDFGIAKLLVPASDSVRTLAGTVMGTPPYMSPEQGIDASLVDATADVWALGMVLYEMVTGADPTALEPGAAYPALLEEGLPDRIARAIDGALQEHPEARWRDASEMGRVWAGAPVDGASEAAARCSAGTLATAYALRPRLRDDAGEVVSTLRSEERPSPLRSLVWTLSLTLLGLMAAALAVLWVTTLA